MRKGKPRAADGGAGELGCTVRIHTNGASEERVVPAGGKLYELLREGGFAVDAPCGGRGTCGKCTVRITDRFGKPYTETPRENEEKLLGEERLAQGYRLSCQTAVFDGMEVFLPDAAAMQISLAGRGGSFSLRPIAEKTVLRLDAPSHDDQSSDLERLERALERDQSEHTDGAEREHWSGLPLCALARLAPALRADGGRVTLVRVADRVTAVEPGDTTGLNFGVAFDIGTTTLAAYLVDLNTGTEVGTVASVNPQRVFGADVISRIGYAAGNPAKLAEMNRAVLDEINRMIAALAKNAGITAEEIYAVTFAGNTTMLHFLMNLPADGIALAPFIPVTTGMHVWTACDLGVRIGGGGRAVIFPSVSGYVGADTVAAVLSTGMYRDEEVSLLVDIGTNGEIVLGSRDGMFACSAAAGPAFEGAGIRNGVCGIRGAIDSVRLAPEVRCTTIGNDPAVGICGSGIVDAVAQLLMAGILDTGGKFIGDPSACPIEALRERIMKINGQAAFLLCVREDCGTGVDIAVTQKDVRELQNAKAAIAAGIRVLSRTAGIPLAAVKKVYLAGGFGSYLRVESAIAIGLLPKALEGRIESVGNASGAGAVEGLRSREALREASRIAKRIRYVELSYSREFLSEYLSCMKLGPGEI